MFFNIMILLLLISALCPIYTYLLYPLILRQFKSNTYIKKRIDVRVSIVLVVSDISRKIDEKFANIRKLDYPAELVETLVTEPKDINKTIETATGEIIVFTNADDMFDREAVSRITECFSDERVGAVCGAMLTNTGHSSALWRYEKAVREFESACGQLSGANNVIFAIRRENFTLIPSGMLNYAFFSTQSTSLAGYDCIYNSEAKAYGVTETVGFEKHVLNGVSNYQLLWHFRRLLLPVHGSFVYISHRVFKWIVPFNMLFMLLSSAILGVLHYKIGLILLMCQLLAYGVLGVYSLLEKSGKTTSPNVLNRILNTLSYFVSLNIAYLLGFFRWISDPKYRVKVETKWWSC